MPPCGFWPPLLRNPGDGPALVVTKSEKGNQFNLVVFTKSIALRTKLPFNKTEAIALQVQFACHLGLIDVTYCSLFYIYIIILLKHRCEKVVRLTEHSDVITPLLRGVPRLGFALGRALARAGPGHSHCSTVVSSSKRFINYTVSEIYEP